jgi:hypothetical protein
MQLPVIAGFLDRHFDFKATRIDRALQPTLGGIG